MVAKLMRGCWIGRFGIDVTHCEMDANKVLVAVGELIGWNEARS